MRGSITKRAPAVSGKKLGMETLTHRTSLNSYEDFAPSNILETDFKLYIEFTIVKAYRVLKWLRRSLLGQAGGQRNTWLGSESLCVQLFGVVRAAERICPFLCLLHVYSPWVESFNHFYFAPSHQRGIAGSL